MSFLSGLSNIGYVAGGAVKGWNQQQEEQRAREELAMRREEADRKKSEWARQDEERVGLENANKPIEVQRLGGGEEFGPTAYRIPGDTTNRTLEEANTAAATARDTNVSNFLKSKGRYQDAASFAQLGLMPGHAELQQQQLKSGANKLEGEARVSSAMKQYDDLRADLEAGGDKRLAAAKKVLGALASDPNSPFGGTIKNMNGKNMVILSSTDIDPKTGEYVTTNRPPVDLNDLPPEALSSALNHYMESVQASAVPGGLSALSAKQNQNRTRQDTALIARFGREATAKAAAATASASRESTQAWKEVQLASTEAQKIAGLENARMASLTKAVDKYAEANPMPSDPKSKEYGAWQLAQEAIIDRHNTLWPKTVLNKDGKVAAPSSAPTGATGDIKVPPNRMNAASASKGEPSQAAAQKGGIESNAPSIMDRLRAAQPLPTEQQNDMSFPEWAAYATGRGAAKSAVTYADYLDWLANSSGGAAGGLMENTLLFPTMQVGQRMGGAFKQGITGK